MWRDNRNRFFATTIQHALQCNSHIERIDHKFVENVHSEMKVSSIYAAVETAKKNVCVITPAGWQNTCKLARKKNPYSVVQLSTQLIISFNDMEAQVQVDLNQFKWRIVKWIRYAWAKKIHLR